MKVEVSASDIEQRKADSRGRVTLGAEFADKIITVAVLDVEGGGPESGGPRGTHRIGWLRMLHRD